MKRSAHRPRLDQRSSLPQRRPDVGLHDVDAGGELQLGRRLNLRVDATRLADDLEEPFCARALGERAARESPRANLVPRDALQLEKPLSVDKLAADKPGERATFEDLEVNG